MSVSFWDQFLPGLLSGLIVLGVGNIPKLWVGWTNRRRPSSNEAEGGNSAHQQVSGSGNTVTSNQKIELHTVENYIHYDSELSSQPRNSSNSESEGPIVVAGIAFLIALGLLYQLYPTMIAIVTLGGCVGLAALTVQVRRSTRAVITELPEGSRRTTTATLVACLSGIAVVILLRYTPFGTLSFGEVEKVTVASQENKESQFPDLIAAFSALVDAFGIDGITVIYIQAASLVFLWICLIRLTGQLVAWGTFIKFATRKTRSRKLIRRANKFADNASQVLMITFFSSLMAIICASGLVSRLFDLTPNLDQIMQ
jgi:hypothetical protein